MARRAVLLALALLVGAYYLLCARAMSYRFEWRDDLDGFYNYLGRAFAHGHSLHRNRAFSEAVGASRSLRPGCRRLHQEARHGVLSRPLLPVSWRRSGRAAVHALAVGHRPRRAGTLGPRRFLLCRVSFLGRHAAARALHSGAALAVYNLLQGIPSSDTVIQNQLAAFGRQIDQLRMDMDARFDIVDSGLNTISRIRKIGWQAGLACIICNRVILMSNPGAIASQSWSLSLQLFLCLQVLDVFTTWLGFRLGLHAASPFIQVLMRMGPMAGLLASKAVALSLGGLCLWRQRLRVILSINYWYAALVIWNLALIVSR
jgi:hypothetical protein